LPIAFSSYEKLQSELNDKVKNTYTVNFWKQTAKKFQNVPVPRKRKLKKKKKKHFENGFPHLELNGFV